MVPLHNWIRIGIEQLITYLDFQNMGIKSLSAHSNLSTKKQTTFDQIDELFLDYLQKSTFIKVDIYKSPLSQFTLEHVQVKTFGGSFSSKVIAALCAIRLDQLIFHHLEIILQGTKGSQTFFALLSYGADGLQCKVKKFAQDEQKIKKKSSLQSRRANNKLLKSFSSSTKITGQSVHQFIKTYFESNQTYNTLTNNCQKFTQQFMQKVWKIRI